jgi:hypothetical protein
MLLYWIYSHYTVVYVLNSLHCSLPRRYCYHSYLKSIYRDQGMGQVWSAKAKKNKSATRKCNYKHNNVSIMIRLCVRNKQTQRPYSASASKTRTLMLDSSSGAINRSPSTIAPVMERYNVPS